MGPDHNSTTLVNVSFLHSASYCFSSSSADCKFKATSTILLATSSISTVLNLLFLIVVNRTRSYHANVRLLLQNFCLSSLLLAAHTFGVSVYNVLATVLGFVEVLSARPSICQAWRLLSDVCHVTRTCSLGALAVERLISNLTSHFGEHDRPTRLAVGLVGVCWLCGIGNYLLLVGLASSMDSADAISYSTSSVFCLCHWTASPPLWTLGVNLMACLITYGATLVAYYYLYRRSADALLLFSSRIRARWSDHSGLVERYHLAKNVRLCQLIWPILIIRLIMDISCSIIELSVRLSHQNSTTSSGIDLVFFTLIMANILSIDILCHPIVLITREGRLKRSALRIFPLLGRCIQVDEDNNSDMQQHSVEEVTQLTGQGRLKFRRRSPTGETLELVDYRMNPEQHGNILSAMWSDCGKV